MALIQPGRVCIKKFGRDAGSRAVITSVDKDGSFVKVMTGTRPKERKCNPSHLEFLNETVDLSNKDLVTKTLGIRAKKPRAAPAQEPAKGKGRK